MRGLTTLMLVFTGCGAASLDWRNHASLRTTGEGADIRVAQIDPTERVTAAISQNIHYVAVSLDTVFFRDLPGLRDRSVAVGVDVDGVIDGRKLRGVIDVKESVGKNAFLAIDNVVAVEPFLYSGRPVTITLSFRAVPQADVGIAKEATLAKLGAKLDPHNRAMVDLASEKFTQVLGAIGGAAKTWSYSFTLFPADTTYRDKPEMLLTATRHILLAIPPADAPPDLRERLSPYKLVDRLKMRGNRLVDAATGDEFTGAPYIVLNVTRFKRYPRRDTPLRKLIAQADTFLAEGHLDVLPMLVRSINAEIGNDTVLTAREKNLERSRNEVRDVAAQAGLAERVAREVDKSRAVTNAQIAKMTERQHAIASSRQAIGAELERLEWKSDAKTLMQRLELREKLAAFAAEEVKLTNDKGALAAETARPWEEVGRLWTKDLKLLAAILTEHAPILEPHEVEEVSGRIRRLAARTEELFGRLARDTREVRAVLADLAARVRALQTADRSQDVEIARLRASQVEFERMMKQRFKELADSERNRPRAAFTLKWYERAWVWSAITVGTLGILGTVLYVALRPGPAATTPFVNVPSSLSVR